MFTHFKLTLEVRTYQLQKPQNPTQGEWVRVEDLAQKPLPTLMKKVLKQAGFVAK